MDSSIKNPFDLPPPVDLLTYGTGPVPSVLLQEGDDLSLLGGGAAAADHSWTLARQLHKLVLVIAQTHLRRKTANITSVSIKKYCTTTTTLLLLLLCKEVCVSVAAVAAVPLRSLRR